MEQPFGAGQAPCASLAPDSRFPPYLVLLRVGFTLTPALTGASGALLPHHFTLTPARTGRPGEPVGPFREAPPVSKDMEGVAEAVSFLWHWPSVSLEAHVPDVIRHTALRSSDFPPPTNLAYAKPPAATARSSCQSLVYRELRAYESCLGWLRTDFSIAFHFARVSLARRGLVLRSRCASSFCIFW
jgi:hypothetical protein